MDATQYETVQCGPRRTKPDTAPTHEQKNTHRFYFLPPEVRWEYTGTVALWTDVEGRISPVHTVRGQPTINVHSMPPLTQLICSRLLGLLPNASPARGMAHVVVTSPQIYPPRSIITTVP